MRQVVITGLGIVCPLGVGIEPVWQRLLNGASGISLINTFNSDALTSRIAGLVPEGRHSDHHLDCDAWLTPDEQRAMPRFSQLALIAAAQAIENAGWKPEREEDRNATGISIGSGCGGMGVLHESIVRISQTAGEHLPEDFLRRSMINQVAEDIATRFGFGGPRRVVSTACAAGVHAIGDAARMIMFGDADVMIAGGTEAAVCELGMAGFCAARALSTGFNDTPTQASRPWDRDRDGFVMGEGAGMLVLEALEHARVRGATILGQVAGYGMSGDGHHITAPPDGHEGAYRAMRAALRSAGITPDSIQYVNAHGTSTPLGDDLELEAVERLFGDACGQLAMSSTKSATGHLLGAAGAVEAIFSLLAIRDGVAPPTINLAQPSRTSVIDRVPHIARERRITAALSNSFGFGGTNASLVLRSA